MPKEHILVVEDEEDILELLRYNLAKEGYSVTGVIDGEGALGAARSTPPDLILLDLMGAPHSLQKRSAVLGSGRSLTNFFAGISFLA